MADPVKQLYDHFRPDNEWMGELDQFNASLSDTVRRRQFYDHFSPDNSWMGKYEDFNKRILPSFPPIEPDPVDTTETVPKIVPPKELKQKYKFDRNNPVPSIMMAVSKMEGIKIPGGRADTHNQYGSHIVPDDSTKRQFLIDNYGMEAGDPFLDNPNLFTARYPTKAMGKAASDHVLSQIYEETGGDVERFLSRYTKLPADSLHYKNYLMEINASIDRNKEGGYVDIMSKNLYNKFPNLPKVGMRGIKNYVNPYGAGTPIEFVEDSYGKRVEFDVDKMTETDVMLDALHGIESGDDMLLADKYNKFAEEIVNTRGEDIDYFYEQALQENPDLPQEEFVRNFVDSQLRAIVAQEVGGASDPQYKLDYKDINQLAPNAVGMGQDILSYLRGYSDQIAGSDPSLFMPVTTDPVSTVYASLQQEEVVKERLSNEELIALAQKPIDDQKIKVDKYFVADKRIGERVNEEVGLWNTAFASSLESILQGKDAEKSFKPIVDYFNRFQDDDKEITMEELAANFGRGVTSFMLLPAEMTKEAVKNPIKFAGDLIHFFGVDAPLMVSDLFTAAQLNPIVQTRIAMGDEEAVKDLKQAQHNVATYPVETLISVLGMKTAVKGIGKAPTAIPNAFNMALDKIQMSNWYRKRTIKEQGLIIQSVDQFVATNPGATHAQIMRHAQRLGKEEFLRQREKIDPVIKTEKPVETVSRTEVPVSEPIAEIIYEPPVEKTVKTLEQFKETPEALQAPAKILQLSPEEMLKINEKDYTKKHIEYLAEVINVPKTGSKGKVLGNIKKAVEIRTKMADETIETLTELTGKELDAILSDIGASKSGTKETKAKNIITWRDRARQKGQDIIAEINYLNYLRSLEESGVELTSDMIGRFDYLKTKQAGLDVKLVHKVPTASLVKTEGQIADTEKAKEVGLEGKGKGLDSLTDEAVRLMEEGDNEGALAILSKIEKIAEEGDPNYIMATPANQIKQKLQAKANAEELRKRLGKTEEVEVEVEPTTPEEFVEQAELELEEVPEEVHLWSEEDQTVYTADKVWKDSMPAATPEQIAKYPVKPLPEEAPEIPKTPPSQRDYELDNELDLIPEKEVFQVTETKKIALELVDIDPARFQPGERGGEIGFNQEQVDLIAENFDPNQFEPVWVWKDPADGRYYVLAGHHRTAAIKQTGKYEDMPIKVFEGTEAEAIEFAHTENVGRTAQSDKDNIAVVGKMQRDGASVKEILNKMPGLKNESTVQRLVDLSYLDTGGNFMMHYDNNSMASIKGNAQMVAKYRKRLGEAFTDTHENEIFEYIYMQGGHKIANYKDVIDNAVERNMLIGNFTGDPLRIKSPIAKSAAEIEWDAQLEELHRAIKDVEKKRKAMVQRAAASGADDKSYKNALEKLDEERLYLEKKLQEMALNKNAFVESMRRQSNLFASPSASLYATKQGIDDIVTENHDTHTRTANVADAVREIYKDFEVPLREGQVGSSRIGYFTSKAKMVRIQSSRRVLTAIHELTHALDDRHGTVQPLMKVTGSTKDGKPIYDKQFAPLRQLLTEQYVQWYPKAKKTHPLETRLKEGLAVLMEHYLTNPTLMTANYRDVVDELILEGGALYHSDYVEVISRFRDLADEWSTLSPMEKTMDNLKDFSKKHEKDKGSMTLAQKIEFNVFNMYEPMQRWSKNVGVENTVDDPYVWSTALATKGQYIHNAISGTGKTGFNLINPDTGEITVFDESVQKYMDLLKNKREEDWFGGLLIARRYRGDFLRLDELEADFKVKLKRFEEVAKEWREAQQEGWENPELEKDFKDAEREYLEAKRDYDSHRKVVRADHGHSNARIAKSRREAEIMLNDLAGGKLTVRKDGELTRVNFEPAKRLREALKIYDKLNDLIVEQAYLFDLISEQKRDHYIKQNADGYYAPFYRWIFDENKWNQQGLNAGISKGIVMKGGQFKARRGADYDIIHPIIGQVKNIMQVFDNGLRNTILLKTFDLAKGNVALSRRITRVLGDVTGAKYELLTQNKKTGEVTGGFWNYEGADKQVFKGGSRQKVLRQGKPEYYEVAEEFVVMADIMNHQQMNIAARWLTAPGRFFQKMVTQYFWLFAFKNVTMDALSLMINSKAGALPLIDHASLVKSWFADRVLKLDSKQIKALRDFRAKGGDRQATAYFMDMELQSVNDMLKLSKRRSEGKLGKAKGVAVKVLDTTLDLLSFPSNITEIMSRSIEYYRAKEAGMNDMVALHLANQSTTPFTQRGAWGGFVAPYVAVKMVSFLQASLNAFWRLYKSVFRDNRKRAIPFLAVFAGSVVSIYHYLLGNMSDEDREYFIDWLANRPIDEMVQNLYFPIVKTKGFGTIRVPDELGAPLAVAYMAIINYYRENEYKKTEMVETLLKAFPDPAEIYQSGETIKDGFKKGLSQSYSRTKPQLLKAIEEPLIYKMKSFPNMMPIVPRHLQDKAKELQYSEYTSDVAKSIGNLIDMSPMEVDHFIKLTTGQLGSALANYNQIGTFLGRKNPLYKEMEYFITSGRLHEKFYDALAREKENLSLIVAGEITDPEDVKNNYYRMKMMNKMNQTATLFKEEVTRRYNDLSEKEKMLGAKKVLIDPKVTSEIFKLLRDVEDADYYNMKEQDMFENMFDNMEKMGLVAIKLKRKLPTDYRFLGYTLLGEKTQQDLRNLIAKEHRASFMKDAQVIKDMTLQKAEYEYKVLKEQGMFDHILKPN